MDKKVSDNRILGERITITKEIEKKFGVYIDIYSKLPLIIGYGEVSVINCDEASKQESAYGGLCFSIENFFEKDEEPFHSISYWSIGIGRSPKLSIFDTPISYNNRHDHFSSVLAERQILIYIQEWSHSKDYFELRGKKDELTLFIYGDSSGESILQIKVLSEKDYYTVAAWFILVETNKYIKSEDRAPVFEMYWPDCRYYHKRQEYCNLKDSSAEKNEQTLYFPSDTEGDLKKRESKSPLCFTRLALLHSIGYYDENGIPSFFSDANFVNVRYGDGVLRFDIAKNDTEKKIELARDFTCSPALYMVKNEGANSEAIYLGDDSLNDKDHDSIMIMKAETVDAPVMSVWPIYLECRLFKKEGTFQDHYEASVFKTHISRSILNEKGDIVTKRVWDQITWEQIAPSKSDEEE